jgi:glycosyltransferase involved in cell wall biosynthesis
MQKTLEFIDGIVARRENEGSLMCAKRMLIDELGVPAGFSVYREKMTHLLDQAEIHLKRLASLQDVAQRRAEAYWESALREPFTVPAPRLIGDGNRRPLQGRSRSMFVACLSDARVRARSNIIEIDELAAVDREGDELTCFDDQLDFDASVFAATSDEAWIITPKGDTASVEIDEAFTLLGIRPHIFGHWMCEYLPKYVAASLMGGLPPVPLLVEAGLPQSHYEALELMLAGSIEIIQLPPFATARVRRLWCAPAQAVFPWYEVQNERFKWDYVALPPPRYAPIAREMARRADHRLSRPTGIDRVFLGRKGGGSHEMVNGPAIQAAAEEQGFQVIFPEDLGFCEQARLLRHARFVAGPGGSAMFLAYFAKPGTKLCILGNVEYAILVQGEQAGVADAIGLDVTLLTGPCLRANAEEPWRTDFEIDEAVFCRFLDGWLRPRSVSRYPLPLVSIVYLTYKQEKFALDAVRSVLAQTYPMLDIIILDDASPDGTADIIGAELAKHRDRVDVSFVRNEQNLGISANERKGLSLTQGDFIVFFSGDDIMLPTMVEKMVEVWREADISLVATNARYIDEAGQELNRFFRNPVEPCDETFETLVRQCSNAVCFGAAMGFERRLWEEFGWPPDYLTSVDIMLPFYAYLAKGARFIPEPLLKYRVHDQNTSMTLQYERSTDPIDKLLIWIEDRYIHLAHAFLMISELERLVQSDPSRYGDIERRIRPLLNALVHERAQQMVDARRQLHDMGVPVYHMRH